MYRVTIKSIAFKCPLPPRRSSREQETRLAQEEQNLPMDAKRCAYDCLTFMDIEITQKNLSQHILQKRWL